MFARIIPLLRTAAGVDAFDYRIPAGLTIKPGMLVVAPFRRRRVVGLVEAVLKESMFAEKASEIESVYANVIFPKGAIDLLGWISVTTFTSKPSVLKSWLRQLPKRPPELRINSSSAPQETSLRTNWIAEPDRALLERARSASGRVLILTPWKHRAESFASSLPKASLLLSELAMKDFFATWTDFLNSDHRVLVTTRIGAWLAPAADIVLLDEPENDDHKQDELTPRFDARRVAFWSEKHGFATLESFGRTPPIHVPETAPAIPANVEIIVRHPKGRSEISFIESATLDRLREHDGPVTIIHPIPGYRSRLICADCGWQAECARCGFPLSAEIGSSVCRVCKHTSDLPLSCPECGGADLNKSIPGADILKKQFTEHEPDLQTEWRGASAADLEQPYRKGSLVLVTAVDLLGAGGSEDIRRSERLAISYRRLADTVRGCCATLLLQTRGADAELWRRLLAPEGYESFRQEELAERKAFGYPPAAKLIKAIVTGSEAEALAWKHQADAIRGFDIQGPFPVAFLPSSRKPRFVFHLRPTRDMTDAELIRALTPLARSAIIDLDPIAFFR